MVHDHITVKPPEGAHKPKGIACAPQRNGKIYIYILIFEMVEPEYFCGDNKNEGSLPLLHACDMLTCVHMLRLPCSGLSTHPLDKGPHIKAAFCSFLPTDT